MPHDATGRLHFDKTTPVTLADFFTVAGIQIQKNGYDVSIVINSEPFTDNINEYHLKDGDVLKMTYNKIK